VKILKISNIILENVPLEIGRKFSVWILFQDVLFVRFVLYQMSKNINRRLFFMFLTKLAKVPRSEILDLLPQIRVVIASKSSTKKDGKNGNKTEVNGESEEKEDRFACFIQQKEESPEKKKEDETEKETRRKRKDSVDAP
jgi:hypothetical protein